MSNQRPIIDVARDLHDHLEDMSIMPRRARANLAPACRELTELLREILEVVPEGDDRRRKMVQMHGLLQATMNIPADDEPDLIAEVLIQVRGVVARTFKVGW